MEKIAAQYQMKANRKAKSKSLKAGNFAKNLCKIPLGPWCIFKNALIVFS
jgi:hypothetical protein